LQITGDGDILQGNAWCGIAVQEAVLSQRTHHFFPNNGRGMV